MRLRQTGVRADSSISVSAEFDISVINILI